MSKKAQGPGFVPSTQGRFSRHQNKKTKKPETQRGHKQLMEYLDKQEKEPLVTLYESISSVMPGHFQLGIWRKNISLLTRTHLPVYIKILDYLDTNESVLTPSKGYINPKKNNKNDILIQDPITQKTRLIKMETFPILLCPHKLAFYKLEFAEFYNIFKSTQFSKEDIRKVFNYFVEQFQSILPNSECLLWPVTILESLNYKLQQICQIVNNFSISNKQNFALFQNLFRIVNQASLSQIMSQSNIKAEGNDMQQRIQGQKQQIEAHAEIPYPEIVNQQKEESIANEHYQQKKSQVQNKMYIWLIGTGCFRFVDQNLINWFSLTSENIKKLFSSSLFSGLVKQTNLVIQSLNKFKKIEQSQLKADQYKYFLYRVGVYRTEDEGQLICIPLRFQYLKGAGKKVLIKILRHESSELKWVPTETTTVNYTLPNITRKQLNFFYLSNKISPLRILSQYFFREFFYLPQKQIAQVFRAYYPYFHVTQQEAYYQRCFSCKYVIRQMPFKSCFFCQVFSHQQCAILKGKKPSEAFVQQLFPETGQAPWICQKCQPCSICMQAVGFPSLFCTSCSSYFHLECGKIKGVQIEGTNKQQKQQNEQKVDQSKIFEKYVCQSCLKCKMCSHRLKDNDYLVLDNQFYCSQCSDKIKTNNHCHICMKKKQGNSTMKWIQCGDQKCQKWVHQICDPEYISVVRSPSADDPYLCPLCRIFEKRKIYIEVIDSLAYFDEAQFFIDSTYKDIPFYCTIITEPMCFNQMKQKASQGSYDDNSFKKITSDFYLIVNNALKFNMPKDTAHIQAKILKILGEKALQKFKPLFTPDLRSLISGKTLQQFKVLRTDLIRDINNHYPQILLNYRCEKSFIELKQLKKKTAQIRVEQQKFNSSIILTNLLRNSTILFHLKKQKVGIANLFTMPKSQNQRGIWHTIKGDLCYYHPNPDIIFSCNQCCQSYCCMKECIRHRTCACGQKGCKCDSYECGCTPLKDKQKKMLEIKLFQKYSQPLKTYRQTLMDLTQNFKYCLKCAQDKILSRLCASCGNLCSWGYFRCPDCSKVWHKRCYPHKLPLDHVYNSSMAQSIRHQSGQSQNLAVVNPFGGASLKNQIPKSSSQSLTCSVNYCRDCLSQKHQNTFQQILTLESKSKLVKLSKITRYMRIFIQVYFNQGIRLTPYEIQHLILENYDQFSIRQQLFKEYELNYGIIERFRDIPSFRTNAAIQRSCDQYMNDYIRVRKGKILDADSEDRKQDKLMDNEDYIQRSAKLWKKYFNPWTLYGLLPWQKIPLIIESNISNRLYWESIAQLRGKIIEQAYTYRDYNTYQYQLLRQQSFIISNLQTLASAKSESQAERQRISQIQSWSSFSSQKQHRMYLSSLSYIPTITQSMYKREHQYRYTLVYIPRQMPFQYRYNPTFKKKNNLQSATKQFLMGIYEQNKFCLRKGSTCILRQHNGYKYAKDYWSVVKKWGKGKRDLSVVLQKRGQRWYVRIDGGYDRIVNEVEDIMREITRKHPQVKINTFKQLGQFLGFTIFEPFYKANHFTNFLQTNLVDEMPLLQRMNKISELYSSFNWGQNSIFWKSGPASLVSSLNNTEASLNQKTIIYQYSMGKVKPPYLSKKQKKNQPKPGNTKKIQKRLSNMQAQVNSSSETEPVRQHPFITFEDIKKFLVMDPSTLPIPQKLEITLKNSPVLNEVFIAPSKIHKLGLFSRKFIKKHSIVIQYVGQIVSQSVADLREKRFHYGCYLFGIMKQSNRDGQDKKDIIDATFRGNMARYLNHSCDPNCKAKTEHINGCPRIIIYTIRDIQQFQEITYDYQFNVDAVQKLECTCGAKNCQGRLN